MSRIATPYDQNFVGILSNNVGKLIQRIETLEKTVECLKAEKVDTKNVSHPDLAEYKEQMTKQMQLLLAQNKQFFTESGSVNIPEGIKFVIITACGGGGAGGYSTLDNDEICGGTGGGAGAGIMFYPIQVNKSRIIEFVIGKGGKKPSEDGGDTVIKYENRILTLGSGKGCADTHSKSGGAGGTSEIDPLCNGYSGDAGSEVLYDRKNKSADTATGGSGGASRFAEGGIGGIRAFVPDRDGKMVPSIKGLDAFFGAGGGGSGPGIDKNLVGCGGNGFVCIQFIL